MPDLTSILSVISIVLTICAILGGFVAFQSGISRTANEVQDRVINALEAEISNVRQKLEDLQRENVRLSHIIETICIALKSRGLSITINDNIVSIRDTDNKNSSTTTIRVQENAGEPPCQP